MFDYLIKNGQLIDGTGSPARRADVGITDGKIAAIGDLSAAQAGTVIDAAGKTVTPGFIDIHRHADAALFRPHFGELELKQGLTTIVNGNCGLSVTPCSGPYRGEIEAYLTPVTGELPADADVPFYRGAGCEECYHTGTSGRRAVFEILTIDRRLRRMIAEGARYDALHDAARQSELVTLRERCRELVLRGEISAAEAARAINSTAE